MINDKRITPLPIMPITVFDNDFLKSPFIKNPSKGKNGTRKIRLPIPLIRLSGEFALNPPSVDLRNYNN
jgi:hypothetical protein